MFLARRAGRSGGGERPRGAEPVAPRSRCRGTACGRQAAAGLAGAAVLASPAATGGKVPERLLLSFFFVPPAPPFRRAVPIPGGCLLPRQLAAAGPEQSHWLFLEWVRSRDSVGADGLLGVLRFHCGYRFPRVADASCSADPTVGPRVRVQARSFQQSGCEALVLPSSRWGCERKRVCCMGCFLSRVDFRSTSSTFLCYWEE